MTSLPRYICCKRHGLFKTVDLTLTPEMHSRRASSASFAPRRSCTLDRFRNCLQAGCQVL